jgi:hypothetical protein
MTAPGHCTFSQAFFLPAAEMDAVHILARSAWFNRDQKKIQKMYPVVI